MTASAKTAIYPDQGPLRTDQHSEYVYIDGYDIDTNAQDLEIIAGVTVQECFDRCGQASDRCIAATYDRWNDFCFLKEYAGRPVRNSKAASVVSRLHLRFLGEKVTERGHLLKGKAFIDGNQIEVFRIRDGQNCLLRCANDERCDAVNYFGEQCILLDAPSAYTPASDESSVGFFSREK